MDDRIIKVRFLSGADIFCLLQRALCPPSLLHKTYTGVFAPGVERTERDIDHTASAINEVKSAGSYISIYLYAFVAWRLMKRSDDWSSVVEV
jgi:hypothetical protein